MTNYDADKKNVAAVRALANRLNAAIVELAQSGLFIEVELSPLKIVGVTGGGDKIGLKVSRKL